MALFKTAYDGTWDDITITLNALPTSATLLVGRESTAISNLVDLFVEVMLGGKISTGTTPTVNKTIEVWAYGENLDVDVYNGVLDGTDSAETFASDGEKVAAMVQIASMTVTATVDIPYTFGPVSLASAFGGFIPRKWGVFVTHDTAANLRSSANQISYHGIHGESV